MKRISSRCGAGCAASSSDSLRYWLWLRATLFIPLAIIAAVPGTPATAYGGGLGPSSSDSAQISLTILPRVEQRRVEPSPEGGRLWMYANFEGQIERYSGNLAATDNRQLQARPIELKYGEQRIAARNGDILIFMPR